MITITGNLTPEKFLKTAGPWLEQEEVKNNLILGIAANIAQKPLEQRQEHYFWLVKQDGEIAGAAFWTPPFKLTLTAMPPDVLTLFARKVKKTFPLIPGVQGPPEILPGFIRAWNQAGMQAVLDFSLRIYSLERVLPVPPVAGKMRPAESRDFDHLMQWFKLMREEIKESEKINERELVEGYLREKRLFIWEQGQACAMAGYAGATGRLARINMVYTPRSLRKRGFASNLVASLSQQLLESGKKYSVLYADLLNPTSNHIYQKMGYLPVGDWDSYLFQEFKSL